MSEKNSELLGIKVKPSIKNRLNALIEKSKEAQKIEFNGDIFDILLDGFEQEELSKQLTYGADLKELNQLIKRINALYINQAERNETNIKDLTSRHEKELLQLQDDIKELKEERVQLKQSLQVKDDELNLVNNDLTNVSEQAVKLEEQLQGSQERVSELKGTIEDLKDKVNSLNALISDKEQVISKMKQDISMNDELKQTIESLNDDLTEHKLKFVEFQEKSDRILDERKFQWEKELFAKEQEWKAKRDQEIENIQKQHQSNMTVLQEKYEKLLEQNYELKIAINKKDN